MRLLSIPIAAAALVSTAGSSSSTSPRDPAPAQSGVLHVEGIYDAGGAPGGFVLTADLRTGRYRQDLVTGPVQERSGYDRAPWQWHDGALVSVDMAGAVADARAQAFLLRHGWRDPAVHRSMRPLGVAQVAGTLAEGSAVRLPGASPVDLWFARIDHRLVQAVVHGDAGDVVTRFSDWRMVADVPVAFRREERDATGQTAVFITRSASLVGPDTSGLARPAPIKRGYLADGPASVPFIFDHGERGHIVVPAQLDGRAAHLVFDTGAANYLTPDVAKSYGLTVAGGVAIGGVGSSSITGGYARVGEIAIGAATLRQSAAMVAPLPEAATHPRPGLVLQGLTGFEFLAEFRTIIDYGRRTITFASADASFPTGKGSLPLRSDGHAIYIEAVVEGRRGWFRLDTGDSGTITLFKRFAKTNGFDAGAAIRTSPAEVGGALATRARTLRSLSVAGVTLHGVAAEISEQDVGAFGSGSVAGNIGAGLLSRFRVVIDFPAKRVILTPLRPSPA